MVQKSVSNKEIILRVTPIQIPTLCFHPLSLGHVFINFFTFSVFLFTKYAKVCVCVYLHLHMHICIS